jgi:Co/Zn/Cd efflux system component
VKSQLILEENNMKKTTFEITKMDCPSEENLIRMKLSGISSIKNLEFDIPNRKLLVYHIKDTLPIEQSLAELNLGCLLKDSENIQEQTFEKDKNQQKLLWTVLGINFTFFIIEVLTGYFSKSLGLIADSLDMLADSFVYGLSLIAIGGSILKKTNIAKIAGYFQIILALIGFIEVLRRFTNNEDIPNFQTMIVISILALLANSFCLYLMQKSTSKEEIHMKASLIFTSNDVIINLGVIIAGILVHYTKTNIPDLIIGTVVFALVIQGAFRILKLAK